MTKVACEKVS